MNNKARFFNEGGIRMPNPRHNGAALDKARGGDYL